jgi:hypothetical protein
MCVVEGVRQDFACPEVALTHLTPPAPSVAIHCAGLAETVLLNDRQRKTTEDSWVMTKEKGSMALLGARSGD